MTSTSHPARDPGVENPFERLDREALAQRELLARLSKSVRELEAMHRPPDPPSVDERMTTALENGAMALENAAEDVRRIRRRQDEMIETLIVVGVLWCVARCAQRYLPVLLAALDG